MLAAPIVRRFSMMTSAGSRSPGTGRPLPAGVPRPPPAAKPPVMTPSLTPRTVDSIGALPAPNSLTTGSADTAALESVSFAKSRREYIASPYMRQHDPRGTGVLAHDGRRHDDLQVREL